MNQLLRRLITGIISATCVFTLHIAVAQSQSNTQEPPALDPTLTAPTSPTTTHTTLTDPKALSEPKTLADPKLLTPSPQSAAQLQRLLSESTPTTPANTTALDGIAAVVNNDIITESQLDAALQRAKNILTQQYGHLPPEKTLRQQVLNQLIYKKIQLLIAKQSNITISDQQLTDAISRIATHNHITVAELNQKIRAQGLSLAKFHQALREQLVIESVQHAAVGKKIQINEKDIDAELEKLKATQAKAKQYHVVDLHIPTDGNPKKQKSAFLFAQQLMTALKRGATFKSLKQQHKKKVVIDDLGWQTAGDLPTLFTNQLDTLQQQRYVGPLLAGNGYHILELLGAKAASTSLPTRQQVEQMLYQQKFEKAVQAWVLKLRQTAYVQILDPQLKGNAS